MSGEEAAPTIHRARQSVKEQQLAQLMMRLFDTGKVVRGESESDPDYFRRVRAKALQIQRHERAGKRKAAAAARKRNR